MPDTFTHIALPSIFHRFFGRRLMVPLVLIGTVTPDYIREFFALLLPADYYSAIYIFHTLTGAVLVSFLASAFFVVSQRRDVFLSILTGQLLHYIFDLIQDYLCPGKFYLFFPYMRSLEFGLIPERFWLYIFCFSLISFVIFILMRIRNRKRTFSR